MFMVFTTAATDDDLMIVRLAFETIEKIVREHFEHITETEVRVQHFPSLDACVLRVEYKLHRRGTDIRAAPPRYAEHQ